MQNTCRNNGKKLDKEVFEFTTPKVRKYTIKQIQNFIRMCEDDIAIQEAEKAKWEAMISEAEALDN